MGRPSNPHFAAISGVALFVARGHRTRRRLRRSPPQRRLRSPPAGSRASTASPMSTGLQPDCWRTCGVRTPAAGGLDRLPLRSALVALDSLGVRMLVLSGSGRTPRARDAGSGSMAVELDLDGAQALVLLVGEPLMALAVAQQLIAPRHDEIASM